MLIILSIFYAIPLKGSPWSAVENCGIVTHGHNILQVTLLYSKSDIRASILVNDYEK